MITPMATAEPENVSIKTSIRVSDFVNRGPEFDAIYIHPPLLDACSQVIEFHSLNGATRFVPGSQHLRDEPGDAHVLACGPAGSMIVFNGSCWHGFSANRTAGGRRSIQGAFIQRDATPGTVWSTRMRPETLTRISDLAKYVLNV